MSATLAIDAATKRKRLSGVDVLPLGFGQASLPVHPLLIEALAAGAWNNGYGAVAGSEELRSAAAGYWTRRRLETDANFVVVGPGSKLLLYTAVQAIRGDIAMPQPSWVTYAAQAALLGREAHLIPTRDGRGGVPDADALNEAIRTKPRGNRIRAVIVTLPDNPTGQLAHPGAIRALCEVAREHDLVVISDEIYRDVLHDPATRFLSPAEVAPERTIVTTGLSKNLALGGWRLGVMRLPDSPIGGLIRSRVASAVSETWSSVTQPVQHAAAVAFEEPDELVARVRDSARLHGRIARSVSRLCGAAGALVPEPDGAFYLYPSFEGHRERLATQYGVHTSAQLARLLLNDADVAALPGVDFGEPSHSLTLRLATACIYGDSEEQRLEALAHPEPEALPWISASLGQLSIGLDKLFA